MQKIFDVMKDNILWIIIGLMVFSFAMIAIQSNGDAKKLDSAFVNASKTTNMHMGQADAPVNIVVYTDFLCPFCSSFANEVMPKITEEYIKTGKAQVEVRPVGMIGLDSGVAAEAAFCAADQKQFWPFHDGLYRYVAENIVGSGVNTREQSVLPESVLTAILTDSSAYDEAKFASCVSDDVHAETVTRATADATAQGVSGTPHVMVNGNHIQNPSYDLMSSVIKAQL